MTSIRSRVNGERELAEFLNFAMRNLRKILECDPEISAAEIETMVMKLPQMLLETAPLLARSEQSDDMPTTCLSFDA